MAIGSALGAIAGYFGRWVDEIIMRLTDLVFAFPTIILAMVIAAALGPSLTNAALALLIVSWTPYARVTRSLVITVRQSEYVVAGRLLGAGSFTSLRRDVVPNVSSTIVILGMLNVGTMILDMSALSFLGLGVIPPAADWGSMVSEGTKHFTSWWIALFPGLAILTTVVGFNLLGDSMRDALDPQTSKLVKEGAR
jgi:peptide/nickel transport system permease protein